MKTKPLLLAIITLIIGFVLGMLTSAQLRFHRLKPMRVYFSEERFREGFYKAIQPDEKQKEKIDVILDKYARISSDTRSEFRKELDSNLNSLRKELDLVLTKEQIASIREMEEKRQKMMKEERERYKNDTINPRGHFGHRGRGVPQYREDPSHDSPPPPPPDPSNLPGGDTTRSGN